MRTTDSGNVSFVSFEERPVKLSNALNRSAREIALAAFVLGCVATACAVLPSRAGSAARSPHPQRIFNGRNLSGWVQVPAHSWIVKNGAMSSLGVGRGMIYTAKNYSNYKLSFEARQISGNHQACFLIFCTRPKPLSKPLDALAGIQFQIPNGGHWDYRQGHNNGGGREFHKLPHKQFNIHRWYRVEIRVNASAGTARMRVAQPVNSKAVPVLNFTNRAAGKIGPVAFQMHNAGLFDQYKDVVIREYSRKVARGNGH